MSIDISDKDFKMLVHALEYVRDRYCTTDEEIDEYTDLIERMRKLGVEMEQLRKLNVQ